MEPAKIDWKRVESIFVEDKLYENINAPKWVDFLNPEDDSVDDESWFCRPDCKHPKVADFFRTTPTSKSMRSADKSKKPLGNWNLREEKLKRRGQNQTSSDRSIFSEDGENQDPNLSTPPTYEAKFMKAMIKSSTEKKKPADDISQNNETPKLKSTLSARNLFAGKDILSHISEFCNELKKMATRAREREGDEKLNERDSSAGGKEDTALVHQVSREILGEVNLKEKERKPLFKSEGIEKVVKEQRRRIKVIDDAENIPAPLNLENVKYKGEEHSLLIRTNPPSPQCFSAIRAPTKTNLSKASKPRLMERGILQEVTRNKEDTEDKGLDVFWFLKPCTLSN